MRKRLRKKLYLGEFQELGFDIHFRLADSLPASDVDQFLNAFIAEVVEPRRLQCGGAGDREWHMFVTHAEDHSASEDDRHVIEQWLVTNAHVTDVHCGPLVDAWHPDEGK